MPSMLLLLLMDDFYSSYGRFEFQLAIDSRKSISAKCAMYIFLTSHRQCLSATRHNSYRFIVCIQRKES